MKYIKLFENFSLNEAQRKLSKSFKENLNSIITSIYNEPKIQYLIKLAENINTSNGKHNYCADNKLGEFLEAFKLEFPGIDIYDDEELNSGINIPFYGSIKPLYKHKPNTVVFIYYIIDKLREGKSFFHRDSKTVFGSKSLFSNLTKICEEELTFLKDLHMLYKIKNTNTTNYTIYLYQIDTKKYFKYDDIKYDIMQLLDILILKGFDIDNIILKCPGGYTNIGYQYFYREFNIKDILNDTVDIHYNIFDIEIFLHKKG